MADNNEKKTYRGNCHCGAFVFELHVPTITTLTFCNCSICSKKAYAWAMVGTDDLNVVKGGVDDLTSYTFGSGAFTHKFCPKCGVGLYAQNKNYPSNMNMGVNARALQGLDWEPLTKTEYDGASKLQPPYKPPAYTGPAPESTSLPDACPTVYHGSCHCGAVQLAFNPWRPLEEWDVKTDNAERVVDCNCSVCFRAGYLWVYPKPNRVAMTGKENLSWYGFNSGFFQKAFCKTCGVHLINGKAPMTAEELAAKPEQWREKREDKEGKLPFPINIKCLNDFDWRTLKTKPLDGWGTIDPQYVNP